MRLQPGILRHLLGPEAGADLELARGTVRELRLSIPWARILAQAQPVIQVTLRTVEVVVVRRRKQQPGGDGNEQEQAAAPATAPSDAAAGAAAAGGGDVAEHPAGGGGKAAPGAGAAPAGWLLSLGKKLAMNVTLKVENLTVQYEEEGAGVVASAYIWCVNFTKVSIRWALAIESVD